MRRQPQYNDPAANSIIAAQMQMTAQRSQHASEMNRYPGQRESMHPEDEYQYRQWERNAARGSNPPPSQMYREGSGTDMYQAQRSDPKMASEKQNVDSRILAREQSKEMGYEDNSLPQTFEGLEQKFFEDISNLIKEQQDAEDVENARHRERLAEINAQYQEKLLSIRAHQSARREDFLRKESQLRIHKYQDANLGNYQQGGGPGAPHGYAPAEADPASYGDARAMYGRDHYESYRERPQPAGADRGRALEPRGPYPGGRAYNSGGRQF